MSERLILGFGLLSVVLVVVAGDQLAQTLVVRLARAELGEIARDRMNDVDRQIEATRRGLASLDADLVVGCDGEGGVELAMLMHTIPVIRGITIFDRQGARLCSSGIAAGPGGMTFGPDQAPAAPVDRLDLVASDARSGTALQVSRHGGPEAHGYGALLAVDELLTYDMKPVWLPTARLALRIGAVDARPSTGTAAAHVDADAAVEPLAERHLTDQADALTAHVELSDADLSIDVTASTTDIIARFWRERILAGCLVALVGLSVLLLTVRWRRKLDPMQFALRTAFAQKEFSLVYHPVIDLATAQLEGVEAEICWRRAGGACYWAPDFMPAIIAGGWSQALLRLAIRRVQADLASAFRARGSLRLKMSLIDARLMSPALIDDLKAGFGRRDIRLPQVVLSLGGLKPATSGDQAILKDIQALGVTLAGVQPIGPEGVAEQSADLGLGLIELDRTLVEALDVEANGAADMLALAERRILATVNMARNYGIKVSASGVRTHAQIRRLKRLGVDLASGSVFAQGLSGGSFLALVARTGIGREDPAHARNVA